MNYFVLLFSIVVNVIAYLLYLMIWYVLPATAVVLVLLIVGRGLFLLTRKLLHSDNEPTTHE